MLTFAATNTTKGAFAPTDDAAPIALRALAAGKAARPETVAGAVVAAGAGSILFNANPTAGEYVMIGATKFVFGADVAIGATTALTVAALRAVLTASVDPTVQQATYVVDANTSQIDLTPTATGGNGTPEIGAKLAVAATIVQVAGATTVPALSVDKHTSELTVNAAGNQNFTLGDGDEGQRKLLTLITKGGAGNAIVTPAHFSLATITFTAINQIVELMFLNGAWRVLTNVGATIA